MFKKRKTEKLYQSGRSKIIIVSLIAVLFGFASSLTAYVASSYFEAAWSTSNVSLFFFIPNFLQLVFLFLLHRSVRRGGKSWALIVFLVAQFLALSGIIGLGVSKEGSVFLMAYLFILTMIYGVLDILLETYTADSFSGRIRGIYLTCANFGFMLGPFVSTRLLDKYGYEGLFGGALLVTFIIILIAISRMRFEGRVRSKEIAVKDILRAALCNIDILRIYFLAVTLEVFYAIMTIYTPLYLLNTGHLSLRDMGIVFSVMLLPFILFQYPAGRLADLWLGEKEMLLLSLCLMAFFSGLMLYNGIAGIVLWSAVLFGTRVGAALLEIMRDSYFFKKVEAENLELISLYRTARPIGIAIAMIASFIILSFGTIQGVFVFLVCFILIALYPAIRLNDNFSEREKTKRRLA